MTMLSKTSKLLAASALMFAMPALSHAATIVLTYDTVQIATNAAFTAGLQTITLGSTNTVAVPQGSFVRFGIRATVTGNLNDTAAVSNGLGSGFTQPTALGIGAFGLGITDSSTSVITPRAIGGKGTDTINALFSSVSNKGVVDTTSGGVGTGLVANQIAGGLLGSNIDATSTTSLAGATIGTTGTAAGDDLFTGLAYTAVAGGTATLTPAFPLDTFNFIVATDDGNAVDTPPTYGNRNFSTATDTVTGPGNLTITVVGVPEPASLALLGLGSIGILARRRKA